MTRIIPIDALKLSGSRKSPLLNLEVDLYDYNDDYDPDSEPVEEEIITFDLVYPQSLVHIDGYNLFFIGARGLQHYGSIGVDSTFSQKVEVNDSGSLKIIGVDIV